MLSLALKMEAVCNCEICRPTNLYGVTTKKAEHGHLCNFKYSATFEMNINWRGKT
jgi:hypothetical protein